MMPGYKTDFDHYTRDEPRVLYKTNPALFDRLAAEAIEEACQGKDSVSAVFGQGTA